MISSIKQIGRDLGRELSRAWENLAEGWREILSRSGNALTHFVRKDDAQQAADGSGMRHPSWSLLAGEVAETGESLIVRLELPGIAAEDCEITLDGNTLYVRGEKRMELEHIRASYYVMERAYGRFERAIPLPRHVDAERAEARFRNGVLTVTIPKLAESTPHKVAIR